jgi:hypothetical protein
MATVKFSPAANNFKVKFNPASQDLTLKTDLGSSGTRFDGLDDTTTAITANNSVIVYDTATDKYVQRSVGSITQLIVDNVLGSAHGGTGMTSFTQNGVLYAKSTSALELATGVSGTVFQIAANGVPVFAGLDGGTL